MPLSEHSFSFKKEERLLKRAQFLSVTKDGSIFQTRRFTVYFKPNMLSFPRLGLIVSRKAGNSVRRNRIKRCIREFFRLHKTLMGAGIDMVVIAKRSILIHNCRELDTELGDVVVKGMKPYLVVGKETRD